AAAPPPTRRERHRAPHPRAGEPWPHHRARRAERRHGPRAGRPRVSPRVGPRLAPRHGRRARKAGVAVVECGTPGPRVEETRCDVLVVGGGTGGIAAALAAARAGRRVCLLEETDWIGGQLPAPGVSALDEHEHIERFGGTRSYYALREAIRAHYRRLSPAVAAEPHANPGRCWVTRLAFEPRVAVAALHDMARPFVDSGRLVILTRTKAANAQVTADRVES